MTIIDSKQNVVTQINTFSVDPDKADLLIDTLKTATSTVTSVPGWISANLHVSLDRTQVTNYAQCESQQSLDQVMETLRTNGSIDQIIAIGAKPQPSLYDVVWTLHRDELANN